MPKRVPQRKRRRFTLGHESLRYPFEVDDTTADLERALKDLLQEVGHDLGAEDLSDEAFLDYAGDQMSDAQVPRKMIEAALKWCRDGGTAEIEECRVRYQ